MSIFYIFYAVELCMEDRNPEIILSVTAERIALFKQQCLHFLWGRKFKVSTTARPALPVLTVCVSQSVDYRTQDLATKRRAEAGQGGAAKRRA